jgi:putative transposase
MQYRRARTASGTYFFTLVTHNRRNILCDPENVVLLRTVFKEVMIRHPFTIEAFVLLPDHLHCIWTLPENDNDFSKRWRLIKGAFTRRCDPRYRGCASMTRQLKQEQAIWQRRFWEHAIRDDRDYRQHVDYIHYNPVKHGLVVAPNDWRHSSFHRFVAKGVCDENWGASEELRLDDGVGHE